jgi:hypothetical protein
MVRKVLNSIILNIINYQKKKKNSIISDCKEVKKSNAFHVHLDDGFHKIDKNGKK